MKNIFKVDVFSTHEGEFVIFMAFKSHVTAAKAKKFLSLNPVILGK